MSSPGGAGWWEGPDGRWHVPAGGAPPGYGSQPGYGPPPRTSGLAIASLIFSLVWVAGVGSLLAVAFGIAAKVSIRRSGGTRRGSGLSTAGIVVGVVGLAGAALVAVVTVRVVHWVTTPKEESLGHTVRMGALATIDGVDRVKVISVTPGAAGLGTSAPPGDEFVSARLRLCVTPEFSAPGSRSGQGTATALPAPIAPISTTVLSVRHFFVYSTTGEAFGAQPAATGFPNLYDGVATTAGACSEGSLTFSVPVDQTPASLRYDPTVVNHYEWRIPRR